MGYDVNVRSFQITSQPAVEPVSTTEFKYYARLDDDIDETYLAKYTIAARKQAEAYTGHKFITQTVKTRLDYFPEQQSNRRLIAEPMNEFQVGSRRGYWPSNNYIDLPFKPLQSITGVVAYGVDNSATTIDPSTYFLDAPGQRLVLNEGAVWPVDLRQRAAIEITAIYGFGDAATDVPEDIGLAILQMALLSYTCRSGQCDSSGTTTCLGLLETYVDFGRKGL